PPRPAPALVTEVERAAGEPRLREASERLAGLRSDDPVDDEMGAFLQTPDRAGGRGAVDPVDRAPVEAMRMQADLQGSHGRVPRGSLGGGGDRCESQHGQSQQRSGTHGRTVFAMYLLIP